MVFQRSTRIQEKKRIDMISFIQSLFDKQCKGFARKIVYTAGCISSKNASTSVILPLSPVGSLFRFNRLPLSRTYHGLPLPSGAISPPADRTVRVLVVGCGVSIARAETFLYGKSLVQTPAAENFPSADESSSSSSSGDSLFSSRACRRCEASLSFKPLAAPNPPKRAVPLTSSHVPSALRLG